MKRLASAIAAITFAVSLTVAQDARQQIYETERAFEKMVAEKGMREGFMEFLSPVGVMFLPDAVNGREAWRARPESTAALTWNPVWIDVSANGVLAYSIGNSQYRPKGKDDTTVYYGHYISIWLRQGNGEYRAALDTGINHDQPPAEVKNWTSPADSGKGSNPDKRSAGDSAVNFYEAAAFAGSEKAYRSYLADDAVVLRDGKQPAFNKKAALDLLKNAPPIAFSKRKSFTEAIDLAYVNGPYSIAGKDGKPAERGNFVQVWKLRGKRWLIVADILIPLPKES